MQIGGLVPKRKQQHHPEDTEVLSCLPSRTEELWNTSIAGVRRIKIVFCGIVHAISIQERIRCVSNGNGR